MKEVALTKLHARGEIVVREARVTLMEIIANYIEEETMQESDGAGRNRLEWEIQ